MSQESEQDAIFTAGWKANISDYAFQDSSEESPEGSQGNDDLGDELFASTLAEAPTGPIPTVSPKAEADGPGRPETVNGSPLPSYGDDDVAAEIEDGAPLWFGMRFNSIPNESREAAWVGLRNWVDEFRSEHAFGEVIPACWFQHLDVVNELYATMCADYKVWEEGAPSVGPFLSFQTYLPGLKERLKQSSLKGCLSAKKHKLNPVEPLDYDEQDWANTRDSVQSLLNIDRDKNENTRIRANVPGKLESSVVPVGAVRKPWVKAPSVRIVARADHSEVGILATHHKDQEVQWETAPAKIEEWSALPSGAEPATPESP